MTFRTVAYIIQVGVNYYLAGTHGIRKQMPMLALLFAADEHTGTSPDSTKGPAQDIEYGPAHVDMGLAVQKAPGSPPWHAAVLCGVINGIITIPVMTSFAAIIFQVLGTSGLAQQWHMTCCSQYIVGYSCMCAMLPAVITVTSLTVTVNELLQMENSSLAQRAGLNSASHPAGPLLPANSRRNGQTGFPQQRRAPDCVQCQEHAAICSGPGSGCWPHLSLGHGHLSCRRLQQGWSGQSSHARHCLDHPPLDHSSGWCPHHSDRYFRKALCNNSPLKRFGRSAASGPKKSRGQNNAQKTCFPVCLLVVAAPDSISMMRVFKSAHLCAQVSRLPLQLQVCRMANVACQAILQSLCPCFCWSSCRLLVVQWTTISTVCLPGLLGDCHNSLDRGHRTRVSQSSDCVTPRFCSHFVFHIYSCLHFLTRALDLALLVQHGLSYWLPLQLHHCLGLPSSVPPYVQRCLSVHSGTLKLASLVQYVPLPVVGGYLGYVGYFCLASGVSLASGQCQLPLLCS